MTKLDEMAAKRADELIAAARTGPDRCTYCDKPLRDGAHVDEVHRFTPLCGECYADPHRRKVTARKL